MKDLENFAHTLNAQSYLYNIKSREISPLNVSSNAQFELVKKLIPKFGKYPDQIYQSFTFTTGHLLSIKVSETSAVCFLFDFNQTDFSKKQLNLINVMTKLTQISEIIYRLYTGEMAPKSDVFIHNSTLSKEFDDQQPLTPDCTSYYNVETEILKAIVYSNKEDLIAALEKLPRINFFNVLSTQDISFRQKKDFIVSYIAILTRAIDQWGYPIDQAFKLQKDLVTEIEHAKQFPDFIGTL
ncbi:hypothetical protein [Leuconostoc holzapfelii]|uniref:Uncharacterized protein n=1 Tax=Leuconostoc holzapfelii TaxID=434464 RepID=A0A846ZAA1_9LACO|nr:hypothetical protein [Leuconostoc holzapfelii]NKZ17648.1 hypothetical protein [Leuconostoc holzapfelii]